MSLLLLVIVAFLIIRWQQRNDYVGGISPIGSASTIGQREVQQDYAGSALGDRGAVMILADGMGRGQGGKVAARLAVDTFLDLYGGFQAADKPQYYFRRAFQVANRQILNTLEERQGMASVAVALLQGSRLYYSLVGSVRIAVWRRGDLIPVSEGQTIGILARKRYQEGRISKPTAISLIEQQRLYNVLGQEGFSDIEFFSQPLELLPGDLVILMTDGVTDVLKWTEIEDCLQVGGSPEDLAVAIIAAVEKAAVADKDNASVMIYRN
ncbi:MAG: SpoIIE family protein phosphatase [Selenomonadaceae bacterium]|nr:SpoIIE family protein phosphatase [Selenomonadaceae bacterium]